MSHKIAKARRAERRHVATPEQMHLLIVEQNRQMRRAEAHTLKATRQRRTKVRVQQAKEVLRSGARALIVERPIRALWRKWFNTTTSVPNSFVKRYIRWSKAEMDHLALGA